MAVDRIRVMISSRCKDYLTADGGSFALAGLRKSLQAEINTTGLFTKPLFECWINEIEPSKAATLDVWDECIREVQRAHIVIVLYNGDAEWAREANDVGICHAELEASLLSGRDRTLNPASAIDGLVTKRQTISGLRGTRTDILRVAGTEPG